jgi:hypothetical protein
LGATALQQRVDAGASTGCHKTAVEQVLLVVSGHA